MFGTLQDRLIKELAKAGIDTIEAANAFIRDVYLPAHNARFAKPPALPESAFVKVADKSSLVEALCVHKACVVDRVNTVSFGAIKLQLPASPLRPHYVKANVRVHQYPDGTLAVFHGPRAIERYGADGTPLSVPTGRSVTPCSPSSRRGLETKARAAPSRCRPALTAAVRGVMARARVATKKRPAGRTKKLRGSKIAIASSG
jgi:hypothetical protein